LGIEEINDMIKNDSSQINSLKGFEIICESMVYKVLDLFGKNALLSMLFQIGAGPGERIAERIKKTYEKDDFEILEALIVLMRELKEYYAIKIRNAEEDDEKVVLKIENRCFLREPIKRRDKLQYGKAFCRVNKGYFETALKDLIGDKISKIEIKFLHNDEQKDVCVEQLTFFK
jgi:hypothetical protein